MAATSRICVPEILLLAALASFAVFTKGDDVYVPSTLGTLTGTTEMVEFDGHYRPVLRLLGIPYAKPPVGPRRFARPEPFGNLASSYNATYHRPHCFQTVPPYYIHIIPFDKSEDCLYLNLYIPGNATSTTSKYPVLVYIHGGSFALGGADVYSGDRLSAFNDVIVVTINYRLNVFGFLSTGSKSSGNYGLWDMRLALQWIHDHIQEFGGDTSRVTLFGNSAGGAAVEYMATFPRNRGLFQRGISQSGSFMAYWAFQLKPIENFVNYATVHGCYNIDSDAALSCLRSKSAEELQTGSWDFIPSVDGELLPEKPAKLFSGKTPEGMAALEFFSEIDFISGVTDKDGAYMASSWEKTLTKQNIDITSGVPRHYFENDYVPATLPSMTGGTASKEALKSAIFMYIDWTQPNDPVMIRSRMVDFQSDVDFFVPATNVLQKHNEITKSDQKSSTYFYVFTHKPGFVPYPTWLDGATHTMEVPYIFGLPESLERKLIDDQGASDPLVRKPEDIRFARSMMQMWTNFAKTGNPNINGNPAWPQYDTDRQVYLEISPNLTQNSVKDHFAAERVAFWTQLVPEFSDCMKCKECRDVSSSAEKAKTLQITINVIIFFLITVVA